jgi:hypothetical protein
MPPSGRSACPVLFVRLVCVGSSRRCSAALCDTRSCCSWSCHSFCFYLCWQVGRQVFWVLPSAVVAQGARGNSVTSLLYHAVLYYYPAMSAWLLTVLAFVVTR